VINGENPQIVYINVVEGGIFVTILLAIIFIMGSYFYLNRYRAISKVIFDILLLFMTAQVVTIVYYYFSLLLVKEDNITIDIGLYFWL